VVFYPWPLGKLLKKKGETAPKWVRKRAKLEGLERNGVGSLGLVPGAVEVSSTLLKYGDDRRESKRCQWEGSGKSPFQPNRSI